MLNILLVVASGFPVPAIKGGAFETIAEMLSNVNENSHKSHITVISAYHPDLKKLPNKYNYTINKYAKNKKAGITLSNNMKNFLNKVSLKLFHHVYYVNQTVTECYDVIRNDNYDAVIIMGGNPLDFYKFAKKFGKHKMYFNLGGELRGSKYLDAIYGKFLCCSQFIADELMENGHIPQSNVVALRHAIDYKLFSKTISNDEKEQIVNKMNLERDKTRIVFWGRIAKTKGVMQLIQAFIKMNRKDECELLIIGNARFGLGGKSEYEEEVQNLAKDYKNIVLTGFMHRTELAKVLHICDIAVLPSLWEEPSGNVVPEAMSAGLAVIITDSGGMVEYVSEDSGIIVARNDSLIDNLSARMDELVENEELRKQMGVNAQQRAKSYDIVEYYSRMIQILTNDYEENMSQT